VLNDIVARDLGKVPAILQRDAILAGRIRTTALLSGRPVIEVPSALDWCAIAAAFVARTFWVSSVAWAVADTSRQPNSEFSTGHAHSTKSRFSFELELINVVVLEASV
jgi:hypothetical protein